MTTRTAPHARAASGGDSPPAPRPGGEPRWLDADQQRAWRSFIVGTTRLLERLDRELREAHGVSLPEYEVLVRLSEAEGQSLRMADLASRLSHSRSRTTHTVARMEAAGLVERFTCDRDGRGRWAVMTDKGWKLLVEAAPTHVHGVREHLIDRLEPDQVTVLGDAFEAVNARLAAGRPL